jgi:hypothetical protein
MQLAREELREIIFEILREEFGIDRFKYIDVLERLARLEEGQKLILEVMNKRFDDINKRFEDMNKRFEDMNKRFDDINSKFTMLTTFMAIGFSAVVGLLVALKIFS